jgi:uncharacterized membrane protein YgdD (TMEM256/DUF423 family)
MKKETSLLCGAIMGGLAVAIGAFGAHALKPFLLASQRVDTFELAVRYQFYHALALLTTGLAMGQIDSKYLRYGGLFFLMGIFLFSGSLYMLCFSGLTAMGAITPFGGISFIAGWVFLCLGVYKKIKASETRL